MEKSNSCQPIATATHSGCDNFGVSNPIQKIQFNPKTGDCLYDGKVVGSGKMKNGVLTVFINKIS